MVPASRASLRSWAFVSCSCSRATSSRSGVWHATRIPERETGASAMVTRGFRSKHATGASDRTPPGQYVTAEFPVLSAGPTPRTPLATWWFTLEDAQGNELYRCTRDELLAP